MDEWRARARAYCRRVIGEHRTVRAFLRGETMRLGQLEVELRESPETTDPRSGSPVYVPPVSILWLEERPIAVRVHDVVAVKPFPPVPRLADVVAGASLTRTACPSSTCRRPGSWRLFAQPPRPRLASPR